MTLKPVSAGGLAVVLMFMATACAGFHSEQAAIQIYTLEPAFAPSVPEAGSDAPTLQVLRPQAASGLDTDRIALNRSAQRLDYYAASRWPAPLPDFLQTMVIDALRAAGKFRSVQSDVTAFTADDVLQIEIRRCQAVYANGGPPAVHVQLLATLGNRGDRRVLTSISAESTIPAAENRMQAVVAAFQDAVAAALGQLAARLGP